MNPLVEAGRKWIGTRYVHRAQGPMGPDGGIDCWQLIVMAAKEAGLLPEDYHKLDYEWQIKDREIVYAEVRKFADLMPEGTEPEPGDVVVFKVVGLVQHTGIVSEIDYGSMKALGIIHASDVTRKVIEHVLDEKWRRRLDSVWRPRWQS